MLKELRISNLVLVESAEISFSSGLTAITGETGSGKTILLEALRLAAGERADSDAVRRGSPKAIVEAAFDIKGHPAIPHLLEEAGIPWSESELLVLKREISQEGRSRAFINCQMVPISLLQTIGEQLIDFTDQHAHHHLRKEEYQRAAIDHFGGHFDLVTEVEEAKKTTTRCKQELEELKQAFHTSEKERQLAAFELEELNAASLKEGEEEGLSQEHKKLAHVQEIASKLSSVNSLLEEPPFALLAQLKKIFSLLKSASSLDASLDESEQLLSQGIVSLEELRNQLQTYLGRLENDPRRLSFLEERLAVYHKLSRKYGNPFAYMQSLHEKLSRLDSIEDKIEAASQALSNAENKYSALRNELLEKRKKGAALLASKLTELLQALHMPQAEITIDVNDDSVDFFLHANRGEKASRVKEHASGGELSRLMLALQTALSAHTHASVLVFDEIDANVGGQTASAIADTLSTIGKNRQVLCVTHFPQVARRCHHHIRIVKEESKDRTLTRLDSLTAAGKEQELLRMQG